MLNIEQVKKDINEWIINFVEVPESLLNGFSPCPYARKARLDNQVDIRIGNTPLDDLITLAYDGLGKFSVIVLAYDPLEYCHDDFHHQLEVANTYHLLPQDIIVLDDHPADQEIVNGVCMNQGRYALALVQRLSELNDKAASIAKNGFYNNWPEPYLQTLFKHRVDPRK